MKTLFKTLTFLLLGTALLYGANISTLQYENIKVTHTYEGKSKDFIIKRNIDLKCLELGISNEIAFGGDYASKDVPKECKKTFITTLGSVQPIQMLRVKTYGELEVLDHITKVQKDPSKYILIDSRRPDWFESSTIPSAVNLPYNSIKYDEDFPEDFEKVLKTLNIKKTGEDEYDFTNAKTAVMFCNGNWCVQSPRAIGELLVIGYPMEKLIWYRGGIQDWKILGFTTIRGDLK